MSKIIILSVIVVSVCLSVGAQFVSERRSNGGRFSVDSAELNDKKFQEDLKINTDHKVIQVGGFQNGHYAQSDGILRTNLDSAPADNENSGRNTPPKVESTYDVEEGTAFRRPGHGQFDVHSSQGRVVASNLQNSNDRKQNQMSEKQQNGRKIEQNPTNPNNYTDHTSLNINEHISRTHGNYNQNTQDINKQANSNLDRHQHFDQTSQRGQNVNYNAENNRKYRSHMQSVQLTNNKERRNLNEGHANSRRTGETTDSNHQHDTKNNKQNNQTTHVTTADRNQNSEPNSNIEKTVTTVDNKSKATTEIISRDREAAERALNNQITKIIFTESTQEDATKSYTKTTKDNELGPSSGSKQEDDKWIWSDGSEMNNVTTTVAPAVDDRAAFAGDQCPTGQVRFNNMCVDED